MTSLSNNEQKYSQSFATNNYLVAFYLPQESVLNYKLITS